MKRAALPLNERLQLDALLEVAFAPLRESGTSLSPARVRAAVRWAPAAIVPLRGTALLVRAGELAAAVAAAAFVFAASLTPAVPLGDGVRAVLPADVVRVASGLSLDRPEIFARWLRVGRTAAADDLIDPLLGPRAAAANVLPADPLYRARQGLAR